MTTTAPAVSAPLVQYQVDLKVLSDGYDGETCWFHPRAGAIPAAPGKEHGTVVLTMQKFLLSKSDSFFPVNSQQTTDGGESWSPLVEHATLGRHPRDQGLVEGICDFTPKWHAATGQLVGTGHNVFYYPDLSLVRVRPRVSVWSVYDPAQLSWTPWRPMEMPPGAMFWNAGAGSTQRVDLENGDMLVPIYGRAQDEKSYHSTVVRYRFENGEPRYVEHGTPLRLEIDRGLGEPSLTRFAGQFFLTLRNDQGAYYAVSDDGLHFGDLHPWQFDDGEELGSYNTQAHWVTHSDGLFLSYTRRGANNDHVMRHRAPLFLAQVGLMQNPSGETKLRVMRATERVIVPEQGAQLGNFAVVDVSANESWVTTSEGMAPGEPWKYGSNGRVYAARILWDKPNLAWDQH